MIGKKYNNLTVIEKQGIRMYGKAAHQLWLCLCDCGNTKTVSGPSLKNSHCKSCGCKTYGNSKTHGMTATRIYRIWKNMRRRTNPNYSDKYPNYSGRGISLCDRWTDFQNFYDDMQEGYESHLTLDRIDNNGNYEPGNCRWATLKEQYSNTRFNANMTVDGVTKCRAEWGRVYGMFEKTIEHRVKMGMSDKDALTWPVKKPIPQEMLKLIGKQGVKELQTIN